MTVVEVDQDGNPSRLSVAAGLVSRDSAGSHTHVGLLGGTFSCSCCCPDPPPAAPAPAREEDGGFLAGVGVALATVATLGLYRGDRDDPPEATGDYRTEINAPARAQGLQQPTREQEDQR